MNTETLYWVLSPVAYADLRKGLKRQAQQERLKVVERLGATGCHLLQAAAQRRSMPWQRANHLQTA
jgi:hypothetical protein